MLMLESDNNLRFGNTGIGDGNNSASFNLTNKPNVLNIVSSGNVGIGTTTPSATLDVAGSATDGKSLYLRSGDGAAQTDSAQILFGYNNANNYTHSIRTRHSVGTAAYNAIDFWLWTPSDTSTALGNTRVMTIEGNQTVTVYGSATTCIIGAGTGATNCTSDLRLKKEIKPIPSALEKLALLRGVTFHWKDAKRSAPEHLGVIAQEVEAVFPQAVTTISDSTLPNGEAKAVDYAVLVAPLIEAVKELKVRDERLRRDFDAYVAAHP